MNTPRLPSYFLSHGGGPWPYMEGEFRQHFTQLEASLHAIVQELPAQPKAILVIGGHWESREWRVSGSAHPPMLYDFGGFPEHTYHVQYPAPGDPHLAQRIVTLLTAAGMPATLDPERGFDHGTYSLLQPMYPQANIPVVQLSVRQDFDPAAHIALGRVLAPLREQGVLIIGSGLSYHNLRAFGAAGQQASQAFDGWLQQTLLNADPQQRQQALIDWQHAPSARAAHPREDHLLPLMVAVGAAWEEEAACVFHQADFMGGVTVSSFRFGAVAG